MEWVDMSLVRNLPYTHPYRWDGTLFGGPKLWRPNNLGSVLALWLDAEDAASITLNGSTVSQWADKSGNARNFSQATVSSQPTYDATVLSGKPALTFDGTSKFMSAGDTLDLRTNDITIMSVVKFANSTQSGVVLSKTRYAAGAGRYALYRSLTSGMLGVGTQYATFFATRDAISSGAIAQSLYSSTNTKLFGGELDRFVSGYARIWEDGINTASAAYDVDAFNLNNSDELWIGAYQNYLGTSPPTGGSYMNGQIAEIVVAQSALSTADRQNLEGYLAWKWILEGSLPANHPYKNRAPTV
jgi:hypothetical protein